MSHLLASLAAGLALALVLALLLPPPTADAANDCSVRNEVTGRTYDTLQAAVNAARPKAALLVRGTCRGGTTVRKSLTIGGTTVKRWGKPVLDGGGRTRVLKVERGATVTLRQLTIKRGRPAYRYGKGGGIRNRGRLDLHDVTVRNNVSHFGGGISNSGLLRLYGSTRVVANRVTDVHGGGIDNNGVLILNGASRIGRNVGQGVTNWGRMVMNGASSVTGNGLSLEVFGGGVYVSDKATLTMNARSRISGNVGGLGGGVYNSGKFTMNGASQVTRNRAATARTDLTASGGGVYNDGSFTMNDASSVTDNRAQYDGGGVENILGRMTMNDVSHISSNVARRDGGGVGSNGDRLILTGDSHISGNRAGRRGGGIFWRFHNHAQFTGVRCAPEAGANIHDNAPDDCILN